MSWTTATANFHANTISVLLNRGDGTFQAKRDYATGRGPESVAIGDLNRDGKLDLATANVYANAVSVLLGRGDGSFQAKLDYATGRGPDSVAIGDLNSDGKPDLVTANGYPSDTVTVLLNRGDGNFQAKHDYRAGGVPEAVAIGELKGDGKPDLVTANSCCPSSLSGIPNRGDEDSGEPTFEPESVLPPARSATERRRQVGYGDRELRWQVLRERVVILDARPLHGGTSAETLPAAKRTSARANCRVGRSAPLEGGQSRGVISQKPRFRRCAGRRQGQPRRQPGRR